MFPLFVSVAPLTDKKDTASTVGVGELIEITPVSASIARHLGIDLSPEGKAAMRRRGLALVVHGAPLSGKEVLTCFLCFFVVLSTMHFISCRL